MTEMNHCSSPIVPRVSFVLPFAVILLLSLLGGAHTAEATCRTFYQGLCPGDYNCQCTLFESCGSTTRQEYNTSLRAMQEQATSCLGQCRTVDPNIKCSASDDMCKKDSNTGMCGGFTLVPTTAVPKKCPVYNVLWLAMDCSGSITDSDLTIQLNGYAAALQDQIPAFFGQVAIGVSAFGANVVTVLQLMTINDQTDLNTVKNAILYLDSASRGGVTTTHTAIGFALSVATNMIKLSQYTDCPNQVIDVSTDGKNNLGTEPSQSCRYAQDNDVKVNCLGITYSADCSFVDATGGKKFIATTFSQVESTLKTKLDQEVVTPAPPTPIPPTPVPTTTPVPPSSVPPTPVPPTPAPPTPIPPTPVPPTPSPPTPVPPTPVPPTPIPPTPVPPTPAPPTPQPPTPAPPTPIPPSPAPPTPKPPTPAPPTPQPPTPVPPSPVPETPVPPTPIPTTPVPTTTEAPPTSVPETPIPTTTPVPETPVPPTPAPTTPSPPTPVPETPVPPSPAPETPVPPTPIPETPRPHTHTHTKTVSLIPPTPVPTTTTTHVPETPVPETPVPETPIPTTTTTPVPPTPQPSTPLPSTTTPVPFTPGGGSDSTGSESSSSQEPPAPTTTTTTTTVSPTPPSTTGTCEGNFINYPACDVCPPNFDDSNLQCDGATCADGFEGAPQCYCSRHVIAEISVSVPASEKVRTFIQELTVFRQESQSGNGGVNSAGQKVVPPSTAVVLAVERDIITFANKQCSDNVQLLFNASVYSAEGEMNAASSTARLNFTVGVNPYAEAIDSNWTCNETIVFAKCVQDSIKRTCFEMPNLEDEVAPAADSSSLDSAPPRCTTDNITVRNRSPCGIAGCRAAPPNGLVGAAPEDDTNWGAIIGIIIGVLLFAFLIFGAILARRRIAAVYRTGKPSAFFDGSKWTKRFDDMDVKEDEIDMNINTAQYLQDQERLKGDGIEMVGGSKGGAPAGATTNKIPEAMLYDHTVRVVAQETTTFDPEDGGEVNDADSDIALSPENDDGAPLLENNSDLGLAQSASGYQRKRGDTALYDAL